MKRAGFHKTLIGIVLAVTMAAVIIFQLNMLRSVNDASEKKIISLLSDNANQVKSVLDNQINNIWENMNIVDSALGAVDEMTEESAVAFLADILPRAHKVELATEDGEYIDGFGKKGYVVPDEAAFKLFLDRERVCVLRQEDMQDTILFGTPVNSVLVDGKEYNFVLAYYELDTLMDILSVESFAGQGRIRVLNEDGYVIMSSDNIEQDKTSYHFFKLYEHAKFQDNGIYSDFEHFQKSLMDGENYAVHVTLDDGTDYVISYAETEHFDWYVTIVVDYVSVLGGLENDVKTIGFTSIIFTLAVVLAALILVVLISADARKARQEKQQLQELNASLDKAKQVAEQALKIAESANRSKSYFLSNMSHDIRTPINAITGFNTLLAKNADNPERVIEYTKKIAASSQHLLGLINDVLDMSKIESGTTTLSLSEEKIGDILGDVDAMIRPQMKARGHTFHITAQNIVHEKIVVDKTRLNQILMNLLTNSVKYTPDGGTIELVISEIKSFQNTARYEFVVLDNGYGMSPEFVKNIFDSFSREDDSRISRIQGTGLGMAITKHLVDLMGGSIDIKSQKGKGSVFTLDLQFQLGNNEKTTDFWKNNGISRCLVVDEDEAICQNVVLSMENAGVETDYALNGEKALKLLQTSEPFQVILLDYKKPKMEGLEIAKQIRSAYTEDTPVILLMGYDFADLETQAAKGVIDGVLLKPFFISTLKQKITEIKEKENTPDRNTEDAAEISILSGKHILIAEDNELNAEILNGMLSDCGAECVIYENGKLLLEAFEKSAPGRFDLIFMDVQMPVMNGHEATRAVRACSHPDAKRIPIIAMTADAFAEDVKAALQAGMDAHVSKPIDMKVVEDTVRQVLEKKSSVEI